ncbi:hypothetical protein AYK25_06205 [Thermoplasmatales archaeon SM1-50]|nr:MAG: hypothetical protein AYK25_06205 [Thermoplasmatales archaeon SM1-50]
MKRKWLSIGIVLLILELCVIPFANHAIPQENKTSSIHISKSSTTLDADWWPMFRHDLHRSGYSTSSAPMTNFTLWTYTTNNQIVSSPAVVDGKVYVGSKDNNVYCLNAATGVLLWQYNTTHLVCSSPALFNNMVYVGTNDLPGLNGNKLYCLNASNGEKIWDYTTGDDPLMYGVYSSPAVVQGRVYVGSGDHKVYCFDAVTGAKLWEFITAMQVGSSPAIENGKVYIGSQDGNVYCLNATTGTQIWSYPTQAQIDSSPAVVNGKVYIGSAKMYCLDAETGAHIWDRQPNFLYSSPAVSNNRIYCGSVDGLYCLNATNGILLWQYPIGPGDLGMWSSPAIADEKVYVGGRDGKIYCLDANLGEKLWDYQTGFPGFPIFSSPSVAQGRVYIGDNLGILTCFGAVNNPPLTPHINGPETGVINVEYRFYAEAITDPDGDPLYCLWDWGDGNISEWLGPYPSGQDISESYTWINTGVYEICAKLKDSYGTESNWSDPHLITISENTPPDTPVVTGPTYGKVDVTYLYYFETTDPENDNVYYYVDWGDGTNSSWVGPYGSGEPITKSHTWSKKGTYIIKVIAKDPYFNESDWGILTVTMPYSYTPLFKEFWMKVFERFSLAFSILRHLLRY